MNQKDWNAKSDKEKLAHLFVGETKITKQQAIDGRSKVGVAKVFTVYSVVMSGVTLGQSSSLQKAMRDTAAFLGSLESGDDDCDE